MRVLVCGSRGWTAEAPIRRALEALPAGSVVIQGGAPGADSIAARVAQLLNLTVESYPADWTKHGRAAGPIRNRQMITEGKPDEVIAFRLKGPSPGTENMINQAIAAKLTVRVVTE